MVAGRALRDPPTFLPAPGNSGEPRSNVRLRDVLLTKDFSDVTPADEELFSIAFTPCVSGSGLSLACTRFHFPYPHYCAADDIRHRT